MTTHIRSTIQFPGWTATGTRRGTVLAAIAGVLYPLLSVARVPLTGEAALPTWEAPANEIVDFYRVLDFDTASIIGYAMVATGWLLYLVFIAKFSSIVGRADGGSPWVGILIVTLAGIGVGLTFLYLIAISAGARAGADAEASALLYLHGVASGVIWFAMLTDGLLSAVLAVVIFKTHAFPRWIGLGLVLTVFLDVFAFFGPVGAWTAVGGLPYLWILLLAITMLTRADRYSSPISSDSPMGPP